MNKPNDFETPLTSGPEATAPVYPHSASAQSDAAPPATPSKTSSVGTSVAPAQPRRRVGSITLGASLIAAGVFFLLYYFVPSFNWMLVLKIAPAIGLILLGCEVLVFAVRPGHWKYDFVSVLVCLALMCCCFGMTLLPALWAEIDPARQRSIDRLLDDYVSLVYTNIQQSEASIALKDINGHLSLNTGLDLQTTEELAQCTESERYLRLDVSLFGPYENADQFAQDCHRLTDAIRKTGISPNYLYFYTDVSGSADEYFLSLNGSIQQNWTAEQMAVQTTVLSSVALDEENAP